MVNCVHINSKKTSTPLLHCLLLAFREINIFSFFFFTALCSVYLSYVFFLHWSRDLIQVEVLQIRLTCCARSLSICIASVCLGALQTSLLRTFSIGSIFGTSPGGDSGVYSKKKTRHECLFINLLICTKITLKYNLKEYERIAAFYSFGLHPLEKDVSLHLPSIVKINSSTCP